MTDKYTYYIYMPTPVRITPLNSSLKFEHYIDETWQGLKRLRLTGSFDITGTDYSTLLPLIDSEYFDFEIYENGDINTGTAIYQGRIYDFNDFDFNKKTITIKNFQNPDIASIILQYIGDEKKIQSEGLDIQSGPIYYNRTITSQATSLSTLIDTLADPYTFDDTDCWYSTEAVEIDELRIVPLVNVYGFGTGQAKKISLKRIFEMMEIMFRAYWYEDSGYIKFKTPADLVVNTLDLSAELTHKDRVVYSTDKDYFAETIEFNDNNTELTGDEWDDTISRITYARGNEKILRHQLKDFCTRYTEGGDGYNNDGFFLAKMASDISDLMDAETGYYNLGNEENIMFSPANLLDDYYRDYIYCDTDRFSINGDASLSAPTYYNDFKVLPDVQYRLDSVNTFYDGIVFEKDGTDERIGRVMVQSTDLNTNITTFKCVEWKNEIT